MEYYEIRKWLDDIVDTIKRQQELQFLTSFIKTHSVDDQYYLWEGINILSDVLKIPMYHKEVDLGENVNIKHRYSFVYRGVEFVQLESKPLEGGYYENV